jgi:hypothetical protein
MTLQEARDMPENAAKAGVVQATASTTSFGAMPLESPFWSAAHAWYAVADLDRLIAGFGVVVPADAKPVAVPTDRKANAKAGRRPEWPWEAIAFAAGHWAQQNPEKSEKLAAVTAFVSAEAECLTGRPPSQEHCEAKVREWRRIMEDK